MILSLVSILILSANLHFDTDFELEIIDNLLNPEQTIVIIESKLTIANKELLKYNQTTLIEFPEPQPPPPPPPPDPERNIWDRLAECESGNWINGGTSFERGSARWYWARPGTEVPPWGTRVHHGGLQFHPDTWNWLKPDGFPQYAYDATREQQIVVAERVLDAQGWGAWPVCSKKLGLR